jgi:hypothetical protein
MNNCTKTITVNARELCRFSNKENAFKKDGDIKKNVMKEMDLSIRVAFRLMDPTLKVHNLVIFKPTFSDEIQIIADWDKMAFRNHSEYENVYTFDKHYGNEVLKPICEGLIKETGIIWHLNDDGFQGMY